MIEALAEQLADGTWRCHGCAHECHLQEGRSGVCRMRTVREGRLIFPYGRISSLAIDPMEKKPLYHVHPGKGVLSFGGLGCNFQCPFCQNWEISQVNRDPDARAGEQVCTAEQLVSLALTHGCVGVAATYNEPLISTEWVSDVLGAGQEHGLCGCLVSNGFASEQALARLMPVLKAVNIDLKCFTEKGYGCLGGRLAPVKESIQEFHHQGIWVEVTTLIVPGLNDDEAELAALAEFIASVSPDIPWHISAWHEDYEWHPGPSRTSVEQLEMAYGLGKQAGLNYVYTGNVGGRWAHDCTSCPTCGTELIQRSGFQVLKNRVKDGKCPTCGTVIPGLW